MSRSSGVARVVLRRVRSAAVVAALAAVAAVLLLPGELPYDSEWFRSLEHRWEFVPLDLLVAAGVVVGAVTLVAGLALRRWEPGLKLLGVALLVAVVVHLVRGSGDPSAEEVVVLVLVGITGLAALVCAGLLPGARAVR